jgi:hypothetical protein
MRNAIPMRWIEQAEARQVLAAALLEQAPTAPRRRAIGSGAGQILPRLRAWLGDRFPPGLPVEQMQPAYIRQPNYRGQSLSRR